MSKLASLSLDHQITITLLAAEVTGMSHSEVQSSLINLYGQMMLRENAYKHALKAQWGIESPKH